MSDASKTALLEVVKSFFRFMWFGVLGLIVAFLTSLVASGSLNAVHLTVAGQALNLGFVIVAGVGLAIKALDQYIHKNDNVNLAGLAPSILQK